LLFPAVTPLFAKPPPQKSEVVRVALDDEGREIVTAPDGFFDLRVP